MSQVSNQQQVSSRCTLCPARCALQMVTSGPDTWRSEYPLLDSAGLCPRGGMLGELLCHRHRILSPTRRVNGRLRAVSSDEATEAILQKASGRKIIFCVDGNIPCEQILTASGWCSDWGSVDLCIVVDSADHQMLLGMEASGATYLDDESLGKCDGFVIVGGAFSANPMCSRIVFQCRDNSPRMPLVVIDPGAGAAAKFATHLVETSPGMELQSLLAVATAGGVKIKDITSDAKNPSAESAGQALSKCRHLGVLVAAEYGRCTTWRTVGYVAGLLANALGGGVAPQTTGANALAAVRLGRECNTISLSDAISRSDVVRVVIGCDLLGMFGQPRCEVFAAAAALPNCTTRASEIVLPTAMSGEMGGTFLLPGENQVKIAPVLPPPASVPLPGEVIATLGKAAGVNEKDVKIPSVSEKLKRLTGVSVPTQITSQHLPEMSLLFSRQALHADCGELTQHGSWTRAVQPEPILRLSPKDSRVLGIGNFEKVTVRSEKRSCAVRVRIDPDLSAGVMTLPEGDPDARALSPCKTNGETQDGLPVVVLSPDVEVVR